MAYTLEHRRAHLTKAARANKPVRITYHAVNPCPGIEGNERVIEIRRIHPSKSTGDILIKAHCRACDKEETFRLDRISAHRTLTSAPIDTNKPVSGYLSIRRRKFPTAKDLAVYVPKPTSDSLLAAARERIAKAAEQRAIHGHSETGPCTTRPINKADRCPRCPEPKRKTKAEVAAEFQAITAELVPTMPQEARA